MHHPTRRHDADTEDDQIRGGMFPLKRNYWFDGQEPAGQ